MKKALSIFVSLLMIFALSISTFSAEEIATTDSTNEENNVTVVTEEMGESGFANALKSMDGTSGTIKLVGNFIISDSLKVFSDETIDATEATITCSSSPVLNIYYQKNVTVKGGKWILGEHAQLTKSSSSSNIIFDSVTVSGGNNENGALFFYKTNYIKILNSNLNNIGCQGIYYVSSEKIEIVNNTIDGTDGYGIHTYFSDDILILNNRISNVKGDGIYISNNPKIGGTISGNIINGVVAKQGLDMDSVTGECRSGCGIFLSFTNNINVGKAYTYNGTEYYGDSITDCSNYGIALNICNRSNIESIDCSNCKNNAIHNSASAYTNIFNCKVKNINGMGIALVPGTAAKDVANRTDLDSKVYNNNVSNCTSYGIMVYRTNKTLVFNNKITNLQDNGINCNGATNAKISGNSIETLKKAKCSGISVFSNSSVYIGDKITFGGKTYTKNTIKNVSDYGIIVDSSYSKITNTSIYNTKNHLIRLNKSSNSVVSNNILNKSLSIGIYCSYSNNLNITNNKISNVSLDGINFTGTTNSKLNNNTVNICKKVGIRIINKSNKCVIKNNKIYRNSLNGMLLENSTGCNVKKMVYTKLNPVTTKTKYAKGYATNGNSVKVKIGNKSYTCKVKNNKFTSAKLSRLKKNATITFIVGFGSGNTMIRYSKVK